MRKFNVVHVPADRKVIVGKPARSPSGETIGRIGRGLSRDESVVEAHMLQYFVVGVTQSPSLCLFVVAPDISQAASLAQRIHRLLVEAVPETTDLVMDLCVLDSEHSIVGAARRAGCQIEIDAHQRDLP